MFSLDLTKGQPSFLSVLFRFLQVLTSTTIAIAFGSVIIFAVTLASEVDEVDVVDIEHDGDHNDHRKDEQEQLPKMPVQLLYEHDVE